LYVGGAILVTVSSINVAAYAGATDTAPIIAATATITKNEKEWDNHKFSRHMITETVFTDTDGNVVGSGKSIRTEVGEFDVNPLRFIVQENGQFSCKNDKSDPLEEGINIGSTTTFLEGGLIIFHKSCHGPEDPPGCV